MTVRNLMQLLLIKCDLDDEIYMGDEDGGYHDIQIGYTMAYEEGKEPYLVRTLDMGELK